MITGKQINEAEELAKEIGCTVAEAMSILIQHERNQILKDAFVVMDDISTPSALEAIVMEMREKL